MSRGRPVMLSIALAAMTLAAFWGVTNCGFVNYDDVGYVIANERVLRGLTLENIAWAFTTLDLANWHPLTWLSHMLDCTVFRRDDGTPIAAMHHLVNLLWHTANAVILFLLLASMTGAMWRSWLVAALFAIHPLHVESVAWVAERKDVLSTFFGLLAIVAYVRWVRRKRWNWLAGSCGMFALSLMCKPMWVTLPFVLLLLDYWPLQRLSRLPAAAWQATGAKTRKAGSKPQAAASRKSNARLMLVVEKLPYFALSIASSIITMYAQERGGAMENMQRLQLEMRLGNAIIAYGKYMSQTVWPAGLGIHYPYPARLDLVALFATVAMLLVVSFAAVVSAKRWPHVIVGWLWFLGMMVPVIGLVQAGDQARADRYTYLPLVGLFIIIAWMIPATRAGRPIMPQIVLRVIPAVVILGALSIATHRQVQHWRDSVTLYRHTIDVTGDNPVMHHNLGIAYMQRGEPENAAAHIRQALALRPKYVAAMRNLGRVLLSLGRVDEAVAQLELAVTAEPSFAVTVSDLGLGYKRQGKLDQAALQYERALSLEPRLANSRTALVSLYSERQMFEKALPHLEYVCRLKPDDPKAHAQLGACLAALGRAGEALPHLEQASRALPGWAEPHLTLGEVLMAQGRTDQAISQYQQALQLSSDQRTTAMARNSLARALSQAGRISEAIAECQALIDAEPDNPDYHMNLAVLLVTASDERLRDPMRALQLAQRACDLTKRQNPVLLAALAQTQAAANMFEQAAQTAQEAAQLARSQGNATLAEQIEQRAAQYKTGRVP